MKSGKSKLLAEPLVQFEPSTQPTTSIAAQMRLEEPSNSSLALAVPDTNMIVQASTEIVSLFIGILHVNNGG